MNVTNLETSQRLAKVWPHKDSQIDQHKIERGRWVWEYWKDAGKSGWNLALAGWGILLGATAIDWIPARDLSELEAKVQEAGLEWQAETRGKKVFVTIWKIEDMQPIVQFRAEHFINALGKALAVALEAAAKEEP